MRVKITDIHDMDGWHDQKYDLKGLTGGIKDVTDKGNGFKNFRFIPDQQFQGNTVLFFTRAKFEEIE